MPGSGSSQAGQGQYGSCMALLDGYLSIIHHKYGIFHLYTIGGRNFHVGSYSFTIGIQISSKKK